MVAYFIDTVPPPPPMEVRQPGPSVTVEDLTKCEAPPAAPRYATSFAETKERETAVIRISGIGDLAAWDTVHIQHRWLDPWPQFTFTCAEQLPVPSQWTKAQIQPQMLCGIYLGGLLAISGIILRRQTAFDANQHGVMIQGVGVTWLAARGSYIGKDGNFDNMTYRQMVAKALENYPVKACFIGDIPNDPIPQAQINPGETLWDFFERYARLINVTAGSDTYGNLVFIGKHEAPVAARIAEGENILRCQAIISVENMFNPIILDGQMNGSDQTNGTAASEQRVTLPGGLAFFSPRLTVAEAPVPPNLLKLRADNEQRWSKGTIIQVVVTVQGWFQPNGIALWQVGDDVDFWSPSAMITQILKIQTVTFTQDSGQGTLTTLELVAPELLLDRNPIDLRNTPAMPSVSPSSAPLTPNSPAL